MGIDFYLNPKKHAEKCAMRMIDRYIYIDDVFRIIFKFPRHLFFWVAESSSSGWCEIGRMESRLGSAMLGDGQATNNGKYHATWPLGMYGLAFGCIWQCLKLVYWVYELRSNIMSHPLLFTPCLLWLLPTAPKIRYPVDAHLVYRPTRTHDTHVCLGMFTIVDLDLDPPSIHKNGSKMVKVPKLWGILYV